MQEQNDQNIFFTYQKNHLGTKMANKNNNPRWQQRHSNDMKIRKKKSMYPGMPQSQNLRNFIDDTEICTHTSAA